MAAVSEFALSDDRFEEYVGELHEFSAAHRIPCGKPEDLKRLLGTVLQSPDFASEFGSMVRSIVLREHFEISHADLLNVIVIAWAGVPAANPPDGLPVVVEDLRVVVEELLRRGTLGKPEPVPPTKTDAEEEVDKAPDVDDTIRELEQASPDVQMYRQLLKLQDDHQPRPADPQKSVTRIDSGTRKAAASPAPPEPERFPTAASSARRPVALTPSEQPVAAEPGRMRPFHDSGFLQSSIDVPPPAKLRRLQPSPIEILATSLTGLVVALLFTVGSLPVYRTHASVDLPPSPGTSDTSADAGYLARRLTSGDLTTQVSKYFLDRPHPSPLLKQDALSRGMRDLKMGGTETILYADLVVDTAHRVHVRRLEASDVYEVTCDSWNAQFATTFCNQLLSALFNPAQNTGSSARTPSTPHPIDAAVGPGVQIYPHWYLQGLAGLVVGCLAGFALGFVKRAESPAAETE